MTIQQTSTLIGPALDWAVAKCEGKDIPGRYWYVYQEDNLYYPSSDWSQGGPIIERKDILFLRRSDQDSTLIAYLHNPITRRGLLTTCPQTADSRLASAMRCYVASRLGDSVDVPEELV